MKWLNQIPLLRLIIPFALGIVYSFYHPTAIPSSYGWILLFILISIYILIQIKYIHTKYHHRWIFGLLSSILFFILGYIIACSKIEKFQSTHFHHFNTYASEMDYLGVIITEPEIKSNSIKVIVEINKLKIDSCWVNATGKILVYIKTTPEAQIKYGDHLSFSKKPNTISAPSNFDEFNYKKYLSHHHIHYQVYLTHLQFQVLKNHPTSMVKKKAIHWRNLLLKRYHHFGIKHEELAIISALTLGKKSLLTSELKSAYSSAGAMHVLAVSGLHVGIIFLVLQFVLGGLDRFRYGKIIKAIILLISIWVYAFITGLSPSVVRAATMFSFMITATSFKKKSNIYNTLGLSAFVILLVEPYMLLEVGFQLSYLAVIGIIYLHSHLYNLLYFKFWLINKAWEITCVSIAAQIVTAPLSILYFHQFPTYFLFSNLIVIPAAFLIIFIAIAFQLFSIIPIVANLLAWVLLQTVSILNFSVKWIEQLPNSLISGLDISILETWLLYFLIGSLTIWLTLYKNKYFLYALFFTSILFLSQTIEKWQHTNQIEINFYDMGKNPLIEFTNGTRSTFLGSDSLIQNSEKMLFHVYHHSWKRGISPQKHSVISGLYLSPNIIRFGNFKLLTITTNQIIPSVFTHYDPDIVFINTYKSSYIKSIEHLLANRIVVLGTKCSKKVIQQIQDLNNPTEFQLYSIQQQGSIKIKLTSSYQLDGITLQKPR